MAKLSEIEQKLAELHERRLNDPKKRREHLDPTPLAPPIGWSKPRHIVDDIREMVRSELSRRAQSQGLESFDEAEDFDIDEEYDPTSPWEQMFEPTPVQELRERQAATMVAGASYEATPAPVSGSPDAKPDATPPVNDPGNKPPRPA